MTDDIHKGGQEPDVRQHCGNTEGEHGPDVRLFFTSQK